MTQNQQIIKYIETHGSISSIEAFENFKITRLASRIHEISQVMPITRQRMSSKSGDGKTTYYVRYFKEVRA